MRMSALACWLVAGCYAPHPPSGVRCNAEHPVCPNAEACIGGVCGGIGDDTPDAPPGGGGSDAATAHRFTIMPAIAVCMSAVLPDPSSCVSLHGASSMFVTKQDAFNVAWSSYLRFDIGGDIRAHAITAVALELTTTTTAASASDDSGTVWQTQPFTTSSLTTTLPVKLTGAALAPSQGAVAKNATVQWALPVTAIGDALCLEVDSASVDPVMYWNAAGTTPPRLVIDTD